jgi:DNA-binding MarR family transcriptional regulator
VDREDTQQLIRDLLGDAHLLVAAVSGVMENTLLEHIAGRQVTLSQLKILQLIDAADAHHVTDVAAFLGVSNAAASKAVDRLVRQKYLIREVAAADRRSSELTLAPAGRKLLRQYESAKDRKIATLSGGLAAKEIRRTIEFLERITKGIINGSANPDEICLQCGIYLKKRCLVRDAVRTECHYQRRRKSRLVKSDPAQVEIAEGIRPGSGAPG